MCQTRKKIIISKLTLKYAYIYLTCHRVHVEKHFIVFVTIKSNGDSDITKGTDIIFLSFEFIDYQTENRQESFC